MEDNVIKIGPKALMSYCLVINSKVLSGISEMTLKARGSNIQKAVDVSQASINKFLPNYEVKRVSIGTDKFKLPETSNASFKNISWIEITVGMKKSLKDGLR